MIFWMKLSDFCSSLVPVWSRAGAPHPHGPAELRPDVRREAIGPRAVVGQTGHPRRNGSQQGCFVCRLASGFVSEALGLLLEPLPHLEPRQCSVASRSYFTGLLGLLMLSMGITLTVQDFKDVMKRPGVLGLGFLCCYVRRLALKHTHFSRSVRSL